MPFFQRARKNDYKLSYEEEQPLLVTEIVKQESDDENSSVMSERQEVTNIDFTKRSDEERLGYRLIPMRKLKKSSKYIALWMNFQVLHLEIGNFPEDLIEKNGQQMFEFLTFLTG